MTGLAGGVVLVAAFTVVAGLGAILAARLHRASSPREPRPPATPGDA